MEERSKTDTSAIAAVESIPIRIAKADSAFVYAILEASEGLCFYSTLPHRDGDLHRDLVLTVPCAFVPRIRELLTQLDGVDVFFLPPSTEV